MRTLSKALAIIMVAAACGGASRPPVTATQPPTTALTSSSPAPTSSSPAPPPTVAPTPPSTLPAGEPSGLVLGIANPPIASPVIQQRSAGFLRDLGVKSIRLSVIWDTAEPAPGAFDWWHLDTDIRYANDTGTDLLLMINSGAPDWACTERGIRGGCVPKDMGEFAAFVQAVVDRLETMSNSLERFPVTGIQFGNEWDDPAVGFYPGTAAEFVTQLNIVHDTVKATFPDMPVVVGGILSHSMKNIAICNGSKHFGEPDPTQLERFCNSPQYLDHVERLEEVLSQGRYDVVDQHLYFDEENWGVYIDTLRTVVLPPSRRDTPIIVTEFGGPDAKTDSRDDEYHARKLADYLEALESAGVTFAYYFTLVEPPEDNGFGDQSSYAESGLIARDTGNPKPAYAVLKDYIASREGDKG